MPLTPNNQDAQPQSPHPHHPHHPHHHPHIGMRKIKSILAIFVGFCFWQLLRLFLPGLEVHPIFIYIYGLIEIRETSDKTRNLGRTRIKATFTAIAFGLPVMLLTDFLKPLLTQTWMHRGLEITILLLGAFTVLCIAQLVKCRVHCGLAAAIYMILLISHFESSMYLYSVMRAFQTIVGVSIAWILNVKLFPYPPKPGTFGYWVTNKIDRKDTTAPQ